jgi:hypothetical protein
MLKQLEDAPQVASKASTAVPRAAAPSGDMAYTPSDISCITPQLPKSPRYLVHITDMCKVYKTAAYHTQDNSFATAKYNTRDVQLSRWSSATKDTQHPI